MFSDDNLLACVWEQLEPALACSIESLRMLLGEPEFQIRRSSPSMDKCFKKISCLSTQLGVLINARNLMLSMTDNKRQELVATLLIAWRISRKMIVLREVASLLGIVSNLFLATQWVKHT